MVFEPQKQTKKALRAAVKAAKAALAAADQKPRFPSIDKRCKYCKLAFKTKPTYNGSHQDFCKPAHRKAFHSEGKQPIDVILKRQDKRLRAIAREEIAAAITRMQIDPTFLHFTQPAENPSTSVGASRRHDYSLGS